MIYISPVITQYKPNATLEPSAPSIGLGGPKPKHANAIIPYDMHTGLGFPWPTFATRQFTRTVYHDEMRCHKCLRFITTRNPHFTTNDDHLFTCPVHRQKRKLHPFDRLPVSYSSSCHFSISRSFLSCVVHC